MSLTTILEYLEGLRMARDIYRNRLNELRELKQARSQEMFAETIKQMATQVNQRLYRLEKAGRDKDTAYRYAKKETGKDKPRYTTNINKLKEMSIQELYDLGVQLNNKLVSRTSTIPGQRAIEDKRLEMAAETLSSVPGMKHAVTKDELKAFIDAGGGELLNSKYLDSYQIIEDWKEYTKPGGVTDKEFIDAFKKYEDKVVDYGDVLRSLDNLVEARRQ